MKKVLVICGPTATGKTKFALQIAKKYGGELVSADSRQVYKGKNIITGKDLPQESQWVDAKPGYYNLGYTKIWLYDVVSATKEFSVALWHDLAVQVIEDIRQRGGLPIVVGGSGLYIKSLTHLLSDISAPRNIKLRQELIKKDVDDLFGYLKRVDSKRAEMMNESDRRNPRRLVRAIEISLAKSANYHLPSTNYDLLQIGLTAPREELYRRVDKRIADRIRAGAAREDPILAADPQGWQNQEHSIVRQQLTWFKKQPSINWFDITLQNWQTEAGKRVEKWYNEADAAQG